MRHRLISAVWKRVSRVGVVLGAAALAGCFAYQPVASVPTPGARVLAEFADPAAAGVTQRVGPRVAAVEGVVETADAEQVTLSVLRVRRQNGEETPWAREVITFPAPVFASVQERTLQRRRSLLLGSGIAVGAVLLGRLVGLGGSSDGDGGSTPVPGQ